MSGQLLHIQRGPRGPWWLHNPRDKRRRLATLTPFIAVATATCGESETGPERDPAKPHDVQHTDSCRAAGVRRDRRHSCCEGLKVGATGRTVGLG